MSDADFTVTSLESISGVPLRSYFGARAPTVQISNVYSYLNPVMLQAFATAVQQATLSELRDYLRFHVVMDGTVFLHLPAPLRDVIPGVRLNLGSPVSKEFKRWTEEDLRIRDDVVLPLTTELQMSWCKATSMRFFGGLITHQWVIQDFPPEIKEWTQTVLDLVYAEVSE